MDKFKNKQSFLYLSSKGFIFTQTQSFCKKSLNFLSRSVSACFGNVMGPMIGLGTMLLVPDALCWAVMLFLHAQPKPRHS